MPEPFFGSVIIDMVKREEHLLGFATAGADPTVSGDYLPNEHPLLDLSARET